jgi:hypothetical protein
MSREERRAYKRMTKNQDPYSVPLSPAQRARMEKQQRARQSRRPAGGAGQFEFVTRRFGVWAVGGAALVGLFAFSIAWPNGMPTAAYVGLAAAAVWGLLAVGMRLLQRRASRIQR